MTHDTPQRRLGEALHDVAATLERAGIEDPRREARLLAAHLLGVSPATLLDPSQRVDAAALAGLAARRAAREPLAFITGRRGFWTLDLAVSPDTLVPRADSETLIEAALAALPDRARIRRILDLGTGTGCLLLAALSEFQAAFGVGVDLAPSACRLAARNAAAHGMAERAALLAGDWGAALSDRFDLILCNPPYIATGDLAALMPEVARHEPLRALDGGAGGLDAYARLLPDLPRLLSEGGVAILELGAGQAGAVLALAERAGLTHIATKADLGGIDRALVLARLSLKNRLAAGAWEARVRPRTPHMVVRRLLPSLDRCGGKLGSRAAWRRAARWRETPGRFLHPACGATKPTAIVRTSEQESTAVLG